MITYLLLDENSPIGVFDSPVVSTEALNTHFGDHKTFNYEYIEDSGVEWTAFIKCNGVIAKLTMLSFTLNEL